MVKRLRKSVQYVWRYSTKYAVFWPCRTWRSQMSSIISGVTWQTFTKFLHDIATSSPLLAPTLRLDIATRFRTIVQRMQVVSVGVHEIFPKSIDCHDNVPHQIGKQGTDVSSALKALSYGEKIVKIGSLYPEISDWICQFYAMSKKSIQMSPVFSGVTGPKFRNLLDDIEASFVLLTRTLS